MGDNERMDFKTAVEQLGQRPTREDLADALGVSFWSVKQALLPEGATNRRSPPAGWRRVLAKLAREHARRLEELAARLEQEDERASG